MNNTSVRKAQADEGAPIMTNQNAKAAEVSPIGEPTFDDDAIRLKVLEVQESIIRHHERGPFAIGQALSVINKDGLYKDAGSTSFAQYCKTKWGITDKYAYRLIEAAKCLDVLTKHEAKGEWVLPRNEAQIRPLIPHGEGKWVSAWQKVMKAFAGKSFTAEDIDALLNPDNGNAEAKSKPAIEVVGKLDKIAYLVTRALKALNAKETITPGEVRKLLEDIKKLIDAKN